MTLIGYICLEVGVGVPIKANRPFSFSQQYLMTAEGFLSEESPITLMPEYYFKNSGRWRISFKAYSPTYDAPSRESTSSEECQ